jgi:hypothetical protein
MGALTVLNLANNKIGMLVCPEGWSEPNPGNPDFQFQHTDGRHQAQPPTGSKAEGIIAIANAIKDMRAISSVNLLKNYTDVDQAKALALILKEHPTLKSLCGNKGDETELDMRSLVQAMPSRIKLQDLSGAGDAIMLVAEIIDNGALTSLNLASKIFSGEGAKIIATVLPGCT